MEYRQPHSRELLDDIVADVSFVPTPHVYGTIWNGSDAVPVMALPNGDGTFLLSIDLLKSFRAE